MMLLIGGGTLMLTSAMLQHKHRSARRRQEFFANIDRISVRVESGKPGKHAVEVPIVKSWCVACDGLKPTSEFGFTRDQLHLFCHDCREDYDGPEEVLNPRPVVTEQTRSVQETLTAALRNAPVGGDGIVRKDVARHLQEQRSRIFVCAYCGHQAVSAATVPPGPVICETCRRGAFSVCHHCGSRGDTYGILEGKPGCRQCIEEYEFARTGSWPDASDVSYQIVTRRAEVKVEESLARIKEMEVDAQRTLEDMRRRRTG